MSADQETCGHYGQADRVMAEFLLADLDAGEG